MALFRRSITLFNRINKNILNYEMQVQNRKIKRWVAPTLRELEKRRKKMGPQPPQPRATYLEWNYDAEIFAFGQRLGEEFDSSLLKRAFVHRTYVIQQEMKGNDNMGEDNGQLITEGEAFINECIKQNFKNINLPDAVYAIRSYLTSESMLAKVAFHMGVKDLIFSGEYPPEQRTLANTFKAIVGALKQSTNEERTTIFVKDFLICQLNGKEIFDVWDLKNPYEFLLKLLNEKGYKDIEPRLCNQSASNTILANYQVGLYSNKKLLGIGWGESVEIAKDTAALDAIQKLESIHKIL